MLRLAGATLAVLLVGCASAPSGPQTITVHELTLSEIERQPRGGVRQTFRPTSPNAFEDETLRIGWEPGESQLGFILTNKTDASMRILWDDASFVNTSGRGDRVMHQGVKFADRSASMPPTLIVHGATLDDLVAPASNVFWREGYGSEGGNWASKPLLSGAAESGSVKVLLPVESNGAVTEYLFAFNVHTETKTVAAPAEIRIVRHKEEVANCELLGQMEAHPPYIWPGDDYRQLRAKAAPLGADTILVPGYRIGVVEGFAYKCGGPKK